jgi:hypothetical protein
MNYMRLHMSQEKFDAIAAIVRQYVTVTYDITDSGERQYVDITDAVIADFIDGGEEGWECSDEEQQAWIDKADADEIASWIIAGL